MSAQPKLVIGANGFLGSHVTRQLVADGHQVRAMVRPNANTIGIDDLSVTRFVGDIWDNDTLRKAMAGVDDVYYCVVDARGWLRDPAPLFHTNVEGTRNVLEVAKDAGLRKFVFTSSYVTVGRRRGHRASEDDVISGERELTPYVRSRLEAENIVLQHAKEHGLPAVAMCVSTTYGGGDWGRTPHGAIIAGAALGKLPFVMRGRRRRRRRPCHDSGRRARPCRGALPDLGEDDQQRRGGPYRGRGGGNPAAGEVDSAAGVLCVGHRRQRQGEAAWHRRAALAGLAAADACGGRGRPQQGQS